MEITATTEVTCTELIERRIPAAHYQAGRESTMGVWGRCSKTAIQGDTLCTTHRAKYDRIAAALNARKGH